MFHSLMTILAFAALISAILAMMNKCPLIVPVFLLACWAVLHHLPVR